MGFERYSDIARARVRIRHLSIPSDRARRCLLEILTNSRGTPPWTNPRQIYSNLPLTLLTCFYFRIVLMLLLYYLIFNTNNENDIFTTRVRGEET